MTGPSLFGKLLKRRMGASNSPERTPRKRTNRSRVLPGEIPEVEAELSPENRLFEDEAAHERWQAVLGGRLASNLTAGELKALEDTNMPLKHRHALWTRWFTAPNIGAADLEVDEDAVPEDTAFSIDVDLERTRPQSFGPTERASLRRVLRAYAVGNASVGYCQGMNNIAGVFIALGFDEAATLRGMYTLLHGCCPGYHDRDLAGLRLDAQVLGELVARVLPEDTLSRLEALDVPLEVLISEHFLTLTSSSWPLAATARLWDIILQEGSPAIFASFLALLHMYLPDDKAMAAELKLAPKGEEPERVDVFRSNARQGVVRDTDAVLREVRRLVPLLSHQTINQLRFNLAGKKA